MKESKRGVRIGREALSTLSEKSPTLYSDMVKAGKLTALVRQLDELLLSWNIPAAFALLDAMPKNLAASLSQDPAYVLFVLCAAQLCDLGYRDLNWFEELRSMLPQKSPKISFISFIYFDLIEAYYCFATEQTSEAIEILARVLPYSEADIPSNLRFVAHFWKSRAHRQKGEYGTAQICLCAAQKIAEEMSASRLVAVTKIHESWLVFQSGERRKAFELLDEAERELKPVRHALSLGNIESARGRFVRRSGDYPRALQHFQNAIELYEKDFPDHPNLARALVNAAYVKRLIALDLKPLLSRRGTQRVSNAEYLQLTQAALELLKRASKLYASSRHPRGLGSSLVNAGHLHLESGDIEQATAEAKQAFRFAEKRGDQILLARTRNLQSAIERARSEEQLNDSADPAAHLRRAVQYAEEAIEYAKHTQNKRLLAESYIARGLTAIDDPTPQVDIAKEFAAKAASLLDPDDRDHLFKEFVALKNLISQTGDIDETLRQWSHGQLGKKTFVQIQEEFAELVIPKVWVHLGRNVAEVARQLSISPKKVRRILRSAGHKE